MPTINIHNFGNGMADDYVKAGVGEFSVSKHFDILTYPNRLQPVRGMAADTANTGIGNIIISQSNGLMYGVGKNADAPGTGGKLWYRTGYGGSDGWSALSTNQLSGAVIRSDDYALLVEYPDANGTRKIFWASTNLIVFSDPAGGSSAENGALTFTTISQGFVHPKDKALYFGYQTGSATYIAKYDGSLGAPFSSSGVLNVSAWNKTALTLPSQYRVYSVTNFGNWLAIAVTSTASGSGVTTSGVYLWDRDTSLVTLSEFIPWGGQLKVLNNLGGPLVGISSQSAATNGSVQDADSLQISVWNGGAEPESIKEIIAQHNITSSFPSCVVNPNVNFVYNRRLYFSANVIPNDGTTALYGLWSFGKNKNGNYATTIERMATNDGSETGVLAAAIAGDFVSMAHTAVGTLTYTINGATSVASYAATSVFESSINPEMSEIDRLKKKQLATVVALYPPLVSGQSVALKYRVDSLKSGSWTTIATDSTVGSTRLEMTSLSDGTSFTAGTNYEFRLDDVGGVPILTWAYKYNPLSSNI